MNENEMALIVAILSPKTLTIEASFARISNEFAKYSNEDIVDMIELKKTMTYKQIADIYNITPDAVYNKIRRFTGKI
ncbi:MAG: helix-turn-helix domain-containing protein [Patescibacteria group bacterium]|jgi:hypothetical protein